MITPFYHLPCGCKIGHAFFGDGDEPEVGWRHIDTIKCPDHKQRYEIHFDAWGLTRIDARLPFQIMAEEKP